MGDFREHGVRLYLDKVLYKAFIRLQADRGLGRSFAGLLPFTEGLYRLGYITQRDYEEHIRKYSQELVEAKPLGLEQLKEQEKIRKLDKFYSEVLKQWPNLSEKTRQAHIAKAKEMNEKVPNAKLVLALANGDVVSK
jgi:hypothetical protein